MIVFDNIVFNLQKAGGVSVYWSEMCKRLLKDKTTESFFIENRLSNKNIFRKNLLIKNKDILYKRNVMLKLTRYLNVKINLKDNFIFHSSYFTLCSNKNAINVSTVYDFIYERYSRGLKKYIHTWIKKRAIKKSKAIICISESTKNDLLKYYPKTDPNKLYVIHLSISEDFYPKKIFKYKIPFKKNSFFLFVGQRKGYKGFRFAVEMANKFNFKLLAIGGGELNNEESQIILKNLGSNFKHLKSVSNHYLNEIYNSAFCLFYPSKYEGFGIPLIEAQKAGCPVIAHKGSSITEVLLRSALLMNRYDPNEIIQFINILKNYKTRSVLINLGYKNVKRFSWDRSFKKLMNVYKKLLNQEIN